VQRTAQGYDVRVADDEASEVLATNASYTLTTDAGGFAIWPVGADDEAPLRTFPKTDDGSDAAWSEFRRLTSRARWSRWARVPTGALRWTAIVSAMAWIIARFLLSLWLVLESTSPSFEGSPRWLAWLQFADQFTFAVFVSAVGLYVVFWLERRSAPSEPRSRESGGRGSGPGAL
jgi:hypothetical protein